MNHFKDKEPVESYSSSEFDKLSNGLVSIPELYFQFSPEQIFERIYSYFEFAHANDIQLKFMWEDDKTILSYGIGVDENKNRIFNEILVDKQILKEKSNESKRNDQ